MVDIKINCHSSVKLITDKIIYFDPFKIKESINDADIIFFTHDHYDHMSEEDIKKVIKADTLLVAPESCLNNLKKIVNQEVFGVLPNMEYNIMGIKVETIPSYNVNKNFHPKENNFVGYIVTLDGLRYYIAGDTDITEENKKVKCDYAFVPIGGTYTMNPEEASRLINEIRPKVAIPTHYGSVVGSKEDGLDFSKLLDKGIEYKIFY